MAIKGLLPVANFMEYYGILFITAFAATAAVTMPVSRLAHYLDIVDHPGMHKTHDKIIPLLGGLAIFFGIALAMLIYSEVSSRLITILLGMIILVITGLLDDVYDLNPLLKVTGQATAASVVVLFNPGYFYLYTNYFERIGLPGFIAFILIIGWIVLIINAFNLIDGLDGLATGTAAIMFMAMAVLNHISLGSGGMQSLQIMAAGACLGFLIFNYHPARIFMGDTGSMLLGFLLATTYLISLQGSYGGAVVLGSLFIFGYPALDITFAILRRLRHGISIFKADKGHIHHVLLSLGFSVRRTVLLLYLVSILFSVAAVALLSMNLEAIYLIAIGSLTFAFTLALLRYLTIVSGRNGLAQPADGPGAVPGAAPGADAGEEPGKEPVQPE